jgi:hypothetical protein
LFDNPGGPKISDRFNFTFDLMGSKSTGTAYVLMTYDGHAENRLRQQNSRILNHKATGNPNRMTIIW